MRDQWPNHDGQVHLKCIWQIFFVCLILSSCCSRIKIEKINSLTIFLPLEISLPVCYKTAHSGKLGIMGCDVNTGLPFSLFGAVFFSKDEKKRISIHQIPFYGDTRSEAVKRRRKWISFVKYGNRKHWTPIKYSVGLLGAFRTSFHFDHQ